MENSQAYIDFIKQTKATGREKMEGYDLLTLEKVYGWEKEEVEDIIWNNFVDNNDSDLASFMPRLKKYNGIDALKSKLNTFAVPSGSSFNIAEILYNVTNEKKYIDIMIENYKLSKYGKVSMVSRLSHLAKNSDVYSILIEIYVSDNDSTNQLSALCGILWADGFLRNIDDYNEITSKMEFIRIFRGETTEVRRKIIMKYRNGEFDCYKTNSIN